MCTNYSAIRSSIVDSTEMTLHMRACIESVPSNDVCGTGSHVYSIRVAGWSSKCVGVF